MEAFEPLIEHVQENMGAYIGGGVVAAVVIAIFRRVALPIVAKLIELAIYFSIMHVVVGTFVRVVNWFKGATTMQGSKATSDLAAALLAVTEGRLEQAELAWDKRPAICVVMASGGYPGPYEKGFEIAGIGRAERDPDVKVFHAGTALADGRLVTAGGRVLGVTALGDTIADAKQRAYGAVEQIHFEGACYRTDISDKALG